MEAVKSISYRLINTSFPNSIQSAHILNSIPFIVAYIDKDFRFLYLNPPCERFLEVTTDTVTGKTIFEVFGKKIKEQMPAELNDSVICFEAEICLDTKSSFAEFTLNPELDEENEIKGYALFINDITAKKVKEKNLIEKTINLEDYLDNVKAPLHKVNSNGFIIWANNAELNLLGYTKEEYIGHHITEFHANPNAVSDILRRLSNNEELDRYETVLKCKDGSFRNVAISSNVHFEDGEFIYTRCFTLDITEQKKLFKNLYESEQHFRMLIESLPLAFYTLDENGYVDLYNKAAVEIWGRTPEKGKDKWCGSYRVYKPDGSLYPAEDRPIAITFREGKMQPRKEIIIERPNGTRKHVLPHPEPVIDSTGKVIGAVNMLADITELINIEKALRESEYLYRQLIEKLPIAVYTCDARGYIELYNKAAVDLWGREPVKGKDMWCGSWRIYQNDGSMLPLDKCPMAVALKEGRSVYGEEINIERPDGSRLNVVPYPQPIHDSEGNIIGAINMLLDVTDRKKAEENNAKLAAIVQSSDDAIISKTLESIVTSWNKSAERMFGYTAEEMIGESITKLIPPDRIDEEPKIIERLKKGERVDHFETERVAKDGSRLNISLTISPVRNSKGNIIGASKIARDFTRQKKLSNALQESEVRFRYVADTAPVMIWMTDASKQFTFLNKRWVEFRDNSPERDLQKYWAKCLHSDDLQNTIREFNHCFARRVKFEIEYRVKRFDGEYRWVSTCGIPRYSPDNTFLGYIGSCIDIHEQKETRGELEKQVAERTSALNHANINLQKSNEELERFAYVASHDLQEPLRKIQAFGNLLLERSKHELSDNGKGYVNRMIGAANRMQSLIEALLEFSRTTLIERTFEKRDLRLIIDEVKKEFQEVMGEKEAVIEVAQLPQLTIIPFQFKQMISNMVSNALKYSKANEKPVIKITSTILDSEELNEPDGKKGTKYCKITVQDNGIGFDNEHAERIFELFQRLHGRHEYTGSGIGLSICKKIAENHDGFIHAESELGKGSSFHIFMPYR